MPEYEPSRATAPQNTRVCHPQNTRVYKTPHARPPTATPLSPRAMPRARALDPAPVRARAVVLLRCSRAQLRRWIDAIDAGDDVHVERDRAVAATRSTTTHARWTIEHGARVDAFAADVAHARTVVVRGDVFGSEREVGMETIGRARTRLRRTRTLESGTARRVRARAEEELREKRERHVMVVGVEDAPEATGDARARREAEARARVVAAACAESGAGESAKLRGAIMALLHERPLAVNAVRDSVARGYALLGRETPSQQLVSSCVKQVAKLCPPGRYELLGHSRKRAQERHETLTAAARDLKISTRESEGMTTTTTTTTIKVAEPSKSSARAERAPDVSVPTPPLQEPPRVLRGDITVDLGDQSPSLDLEPNAHVVPRSTPGHTEIEISERVAGDDDDAWRHPGPPLDVDVIESPYELEAVKATFDVKYALYRDLHSRLTANAEEYERVRRSKDPHRALERFAALRRERYAAMRVVFDALHDELARVRRVIDAHDGP